MTFVPTETPPKKWNVPCILSIVLLLLSAGIHTLFSEPCSPSADCALPFVQNQGQYDPKVKYYTRTLGGMTFITEHGDIVYAFPGKHTVQAGTGMALSETFVGGRTADIRGQQPIPTSVNIFKGKAGLTRLSGIPAYRNIYFGEVYTGIDVHLRAFGENIEKRFTVHPGADPEVIRIRILGAEEVSRTETGQLELQTELGNIMFTKPLAFQDCDGQKRVVDIAYAADGCEYGFLVGDYDRSRPLVIDPLLASTFLGGDNQDGHYEVPMVLDEDGNVFVASRTISSDFPTTPGAYNETGNGSYDVFIAKLSGDLSTLLAATFLGGSGHDGDWPGVALAVAGNGDVCIAGRTSSPNFPTTTGAYDREYNGGVDFFVYVLDPTLSTLNASTYIGGSGEDAYIQMALSENGDVFLSGGTSSSDFPTTPGAYDPTYNPGGGRGLEVFVSHLSGDLTTLVASTYLGGSGDDITEVIHLDSQGNVYITGWTGSTNFPTTAGAYDRTYNGYYYDAFLSKFNPDLSVLTASTYLGGNSWEFGYGMNLDADGNVYVTGHVSSTTFPTTQGAYDESYNGNGGAGVGDDLFLSKLDGDLTTLLASTYLGGSNWENGHALLVGQDGDVYVAGATSSSDFPMSAWTYDDTYNGGSRNQGDIFISCLDGDLRSLSFSTYLGGSSNDNIGALALDGSGNIYLSGTTGSPDYPTTSGAYDQDFNGGAFEWGGDVIVSVIPNTYRTDADGDAIPDASDNCPELSNPEQIDTDGDGRGDVCDACTDSDGDGFGDPGYPADTCQEDNCPLTYSLNQGDADLDGLGDVCDNCPDDVNPEQHDGDGDGHGDVCDECTDSDGDGYGDPGYPANMCDEDNCPEAYNPEQAPAERGDINCTSGINVLDVLAVVNHILATDLLSGAPLERADCNADGNVNIVDALGIVNVILGLGECSPTAFRSAVTPEGMEYIRSLKAYLPATDFEKLTALIKTEVQVPREFHLAQNYPNPFNAQTDIRYHMADRGLPSQISLKIYNLLGEKVRTLVNDAQPAGYYSVTWDGTDEKGRAVCSGVYFCRMTTDTYIETKKMLLIQ